MEFPSNSNISRGNEPKNLPRVTTNPVTRRKRSVGRRFADVFVGGDARSVWGYIAYDVLIPAVKDMVSDAIGSGVERMLFGDSAKSSRRSSSGSTFTPYGSFSSAGKQSNRFQQQSSAPSVNRRVGVDFDEIVFTTRPEAEAALYAMYEVIEKYGVINVNEFYEIIGVTGEFTGEKYGWANLSNARVERVRGGYRLNVPRPQPLTD